MPLLADAINQAENFNATLESQYATRDPSGGSDPAYVTNLQNTQDLYAQAASSSGPTPTTSVYQEPTPIVEPGLIYDPTTYQAPTGMDDPNPVYVPPSPGPINDQPPDTTDMPADPYGGTTGDPVTLADLREPAPPVAQGSASQISMPGAIDPALASASGAQASDANAVNAAATGYNAMTGEVDPNTMTAAGQLNQITSLDSANMRRAAHQGMLAAARRGLMNSSFGAGAAQGAMIDRATPLAQQDAATYFQNMRQNLEAQNRALEISTGRETDVSALNAQMETQVNMANAEAQNRLAALNAELETAVSQGNAEMINRIQQQMADIEAGINTRNAELQTQVSLSNAQAINQMNAQVLEGYQRLNEQYLRGEQAVDLAAIQGRYQQLISSNATAASMYQSYMNAIGGAMANHEVTPQRVASYVNTMATQLEAGLSLIDAMNGLNLGGIDVPGNVGSTTGTTTGTGPVPPEGSIDPNDPSTWGPDEWMDRIGPGMAAF